MTQRKNISDSEEQAFVNSPRSVSSCLNTFGTEVILSRSCEVDMNLDNARTSSVTTTQGKVFTPRYHIDILRDIKGVD